MKRKFMIEWLHEVWSCDVAFSVSGFIQRLASLLISKYILHVRVDDNYYWQTLEKKQNELTTKGYLFSFVCQET